MILNIADMLISSEGKSLRIGACLGELRDRYGEYLGQYLTACGICFRMGLTAENIAGNST